MSSDTAIIVNNLSKSYQAYNNPKDRLKQYVLPRIKRILGRSPGQYYTEFQALQEINFEVKQGDTIGIIGRNGSGKSTLLQIICDTLHPTSGHVWHQGRIAALLELGSGFNPEFTGRENVYMNAAILGLSREEVEARYEDIIAFADIGDYVDQPVKSYSSGMMVRLAFAVIAHVDADILVIDEALAVGDAFFTQKCMRFLRSFMQKGTVVLVSHDTIAVQSLCNRALWLDQGRLRMQGTPKEVCEKYLQACYEAGQGKSPDSMQEQSWEPVQKSLRDQRDQFINSSNLRNDIRVFEFKPNESSFGTGDARIHMVQLLDFNGCPLSWIVGGEQVALRIEVMAGTALDQPIVGFFVKNRYGQCLFGDNTYLTTLNNPVLCGRNKMLTTEFVFQMPRLPAGDYSVTVAIAQGTQEDHIQHHWIHDALIFRSESTSVAGGLIGLPMQAVRMKVG